MENETLHTATSNQIPLDNAISSLRTYPKRNCQIIHNDNF